MSRMHPAPWLRPLLTLVGGALLYVGERLAAPGAGRPWLSGLGAAALLAGAGWTLWRAWRARGNADGADASAWRWALLPQAGFVLAAAAYGAGLLLGGEAGADVWSGPLRFAWALLGAMGAVLFGFVELALWRLGGQGGAELTDGARVGRAAGAGLWLALLFGLVATLDFAAIRLAWHWDLSYFKTTEPSAATRAAAAALNEPVQVALFYPDGSAVAWQLDSYFHALTRGAERVSYRLWDADLEPKQALEFQARDNGWVILKRGEVRKPLQVSTRIEAAQTSLRRFDTDFLAALREVARDPAVAYETIGHGERNELGRQTGGSADERFTAFNATLRAHDFRVQTLDYAGGLGSDVPADAGLLVIAGPTEPFSRAEADAVRRYLKRGGRLVAFLEPGESAPGPGGVRRAPRSADPLLAVLGEYGVRFDPVPRANDRIFGRRSFTDADHGLLVTFAYEAHPAAALLKANPNQYPFGLLGAGALKLEAAPAGLNAQILLRAMPGTWADRNGNFRFDPKEETREDTILAATVAPTSAPLPGRKDAPGAKAAGPYLAVFADADLAADMLMQNRANAILVNSALDWIAGREPVGAPNVEEDLRIQHMRGDEWLWFYLPVIAIPAALLGFGVWRLRRRNGDPAGRAA